MEPLTTGTLHNFSRTQDNVKIKYPIIYGHLFECGIVEQKKRHRCCKWKEVAESIKRAIEKL